MAMSGMVACDCGRANCDRMMCPICKCSDCKWPSACYGRCRRCGIPTQPSNSLGTGALQRSDGLGLWMEMFCSGACCDADEAVARAEGRIIDLSEVTPERANELFKSAGLYLVGVGEVVPS